MMNASVPRSQLGGVMGEFQMMFVSAGCLATVGVSALVNYFGFQSAAVGLGRILASVFVIGYGGSAFSWWKAGKLLKKQEEK